MQEEDIANDTPLLSSTNESRTGSRLFWPLFVGLNVLGMGISLFLSFGLKWGLLKSPWFWIVFFLINGLVLSLHYVVHGRQDTKIEYQETKQYSPEELDKIIIARLKQEEILVQKAKEDEAWEINHGAPGSRAPIYHAYYTDRAHNKKYWVAIRQDTLKMIRIPFKQLSTDKVQQALDGLTDEPILQTTEITTHSDLLGNRQEVRKLNPIMPQAPATIPPLRGQQEDLYD